MDVTSDEIRSSRFQGTRHVYDRREVDAFLHRTAATLEVYERKLAVTQAHVESLEKALDLANGRARSVRSREARISELETALAAAQHNYQTAMAILEAPGEPVAAADVADHELVTEASSRAEVILEKAANEVSLMRADGERIALEAAEAAAQVAAAARADADEIRNAADLEHAAMVEALEQARIEAKELLDAELDMQRATALVDLETERSRIAGDTAAAQSDLESQVAKAERKAAKAAKSEEKARKRVVAAEEHAAAAEERAAAAEADRALLLAEIERAAASAEAERKIFMEDAERMLEEAVARAEADRGAQARQEQNGRVDEADAEIGRLRREVAQLRTALAGAQERFSNASGLSPEELELSAALLDLETHEGAVVDLRADAAQDISEPNGVSGGEDSTVTIKSKWAEMQPMHAAPREELGRTSAADADEARGAAAPTWRDRMGASAQTGSGTEPESDEDVIVGFYERRLAGLRARLDDVAPKDT